MGACAELRIDFKEDYKNELFKEFNGCNNSATPFVSLFTSLLSDVISWPSHEDVHKWNVQHGAVGVS